MLKHWSTCTLCRNKRFTAINFKNKTITITIIPAVRTDSNAAYLEHTAGSQSYCLKVTRMLFHNKNETAKTYKGNIIFCF